MVLQNQVLMVLVIQNFLMVVMAEDIKMEKPVPETADVAAFGALGAVEVQEEILFVVHLVVEVEVADL